MGASRYLMGIVCAGLLVGCTAESTEVDVQDMEVDVETADGPNFPVPPPDSTCVLIQRGGIGAVQDTDIGYGNGPNWAAGGYPFTWTGPSPYDHWSVYQFDMSMVPPGSNVVLASFNVYASWNMESSTVRAHRVKNAWSEPTATWSNFGGAGAWDPAVLGTINPNGGGFFSIDVTGLAQKWHTGEWANNGLLLEEDPVKLHNYFASEVSTVARRPSLFVCWAAPPPPVCKQVNEACSVDADCCDGVPCNGGTCHVLQCGGAGAECSADSDCCIGNTCNAGLCGPPQLCADPGQACNAQKPCCNGAICNDGVCPGGGGGGLGGGECNAVGQACNFNVDCCNGACFDGACINTDVAACINNMDELCTPQNPCCNGMHCVNTGDNGGSCWPDLACVGPGQPCDSFTDYCCWGKTCGDSGLCE